MSVPSFEAFYRALHPREEEPRAPYRWQTRASQELASNGWWPALRAPTGAGKTTLIDCWLHALACAGPDGLGRRLVWVVDRRSVVDQVHDYADEVMERLNAPDAAPEVRAVAEALRGLGGDRPPQATLWRGGLDDEASIAMRDPIAPGTVAVIASTVDQFGSRLLFRGYGMGAGSRALHAGLLGLDTTVVVDEAHIAEPLLEAVHRVVEIQRRAPESPRPPLRLCAVSATQDRPQAFELTERERAEAPIALRVAASKRARLNEGRRPKDVRAEVDRLVRGGAQVIGVVLNTVGEARATFEALASSPYDRTLLIGPIRSLDRLDLVDAIPDRRQRADLERPLVVVATQTIEVGIDLDFDGLISACAPLPALVQRFGRLDRAGALKASEAAILGPPNAGCPVYGDTTAETWGWLREAADGGEVDMGIAALETMLARHGPAPTESPPRLVHLLDAHVAALTVTDATEQEGPALDLVLHGDDRPSAQVSVAWRPLGEVDVTTVQRELELRPLHDGETLTISLSALRRWLRAREAGPLSDVESVASDEEVLLGRARVRAWRIDPKGEIEAITDVTRVSPADRIVVDAAAGGVDRFGWAPARSAPASDLGSLAHRGPRLVLSGDDADVREARIALESGEITDSEAASRLRASITRALPDAEHDHRPRFSEHVGRVAAALAAGRATVLEDGRVLVLGRQARSEQSVSGGVVTLTDHQTEVEAHLRATLAALGLEGRLAISMGRAARHHDEGKRDPRFQAWLTAGRPVPGALAKSAYAYNPARSRRLREAAGWPAGKRHELVSAVAVRAAFPDDALAAWLVATHHGANRPFCAAVDDPGDHQVETVIDEERVAVPCDATPPVDWQLGTFAQLTRDFGPWGLAYLEALLVGADRTVSAGGGAG